MSLLKFIIALLMVSLACNANSTDLPNDTVIESKISYNQYVVVIHGGAGNITRNNIPISAQKQYREALQNALIKAQKVLDKNGSACDAVEAAIMYLEDSPLFNAGKGAVLNAEGLPELDASIMDGKTLNAGAVAGIQNTKNPIRAARLVMEKSAHVMLSGKGAGAFAKKHGLQSVTKNYFFTKRNLRFYRQRKQDKTKTDSIKGTVGCVVLDRHGNLAAGTSTGGMSYKLSGRIGDSPIIGAGNYANNQTCAVSCTGHGEFFIRHVVAYDLSALMEYKNLTINGAATAIIHNKLKQVKADGGLIAVDKNGNIAIEFNTAGMFRGYLKENEQARIYLFDE